ncbi:hypothetical protein Pan216_02530 [Planctomycetes bacterium Pan216]|uniref:YetF C-terminal domain-containing protein n=1 Tax=Kolteria novifilia TaxID=2527975 RepID=A0A518AXH0_9BACT|nr:hypothetical protein Pan216_02530 [Planctomycetes bacterium Pan216]
MGNSAWFESWDSLYKIAVSALVGYLILIVYVRLAGKRSTSKMNNFDWMVTVAVGSVFASMAILKDVTVADGALAMALLLGFQYLLTTATSHWEWARGLFLATPSILYANEQFDDAEMRKQRVCRGEIISAIRERGIGSLREVAVVTLEPDAEMSVVIKGKDGELDTVDSLPGYEELAGVGESRETR